MTKKNKNDQHNTEKGKVQRANGYDFWTFTRVRLHALVRTESGNYLLRKKKERGVYIAKEKLIFYV